MRGLDPATGTLDESRSLGLVQAVAMPAVTPTNGVNLDYRAGGSS